MNIDWITLSREVFGGIITLSIALLSIILNDQLRRWGHRKRTRKLIELSALRADAIEIRNRGETPLSGQELVDWLDSARQAEQALIDKAYEISKPDGSLLDYQDRIPGRPYPMLLNEQATLVRNLSGVIIRAEALINAYRL